MTAARIGRRAACRRPVRTLGIALLAAITGVVSRPADAADGVEVRVGVPLPASHPVVAGGWQAFQQAATVEDRAGLRFHLFVNGALIGWERTLKGLSQGEADMGFLAPADHPEEFPYVAFLTALSLSGREGLPAAAALTELVMLGCPRCRDEFARKNLVFLGTYSAAPYLLIAKEPLADLQSLSDRNIWTPGSLWDRWVQDMGAHPVQSGKDAAEALAKSGADAVIDVAIALRQPPLAKQVKAIVAMPLGAYRGASPFTVNRDFWRRLTPAQRAALLAAAPAGIVAATHAYGRQADEAIGAARERGVDLVTPAPDLVRSADRFAEESAARTAENAEARFGVAGARELLDRYRELYAKYCRLLETASESEQAAALLRREAFGKLNPVAYGVEDESVAEDAGPAAAKGGDR